MNSRFKNKEFLEKLSLDKKKLFDHMVREKMNPFSNEQNSNPSHFIYEIIQNAEDEGAKSIGFNLFKDRLEIVHNGKVFDREDIRYITAYGESEKKKKLGYIGKFGMGFKSVFSVTTSPVIESGEFSFRLENYFVPYPLSLYPSTERSKNTKIILPFNHKERSPKEIFNLIDGKLRNLEPHVLLFLKSLNKIDWKVNKDEGHYYKQETKVEEFIKNVRLSTNSNHEEYLVLEKRVEVKQVKTSVKIAFKLKTGGKFKKIIIPIDSPKLIVFFPTEQETYLKFFTHGPYLTNQSRESILADNEDNKILIEKTGQLIAESLKTAKHLKLLNINFLNCLPINSDFTSKSPVYSEAYKRVLDELKSDKKYLPASDNGFASVSNSLLSKNRELNSLLKSRDIKFLFKKSTWLNPNITENETPELRNYLINELSVEEKSIDDFAVAIDAPFLRKKSDKWMINFYTLLGKNERLWKKREYPFQGQKPLRIKPIIRLENGSHCAPFDESDTKLVYLPTSDVATEYPTVKKRIAQNRTALKFLKNLGLTEPDLLAEIQKYILPRYKRNRRVTDSKNLEDFKKLLTFIEKNQSGEHEAVIETLHTLPILKAYNPLTGIVQFKAPAELYFPELENYFSKYDKAFFVDLDFYKNTGRVKLHNFLSKLAVENKPRRIPIERKLDPEQRKNLRRKCGNERMNLTSEEREENYILEGLEEMLTNITKTASINLWKMLLLLPDDYYDSFYYWRYKNSDRSQKFDVKFLETLREAKWLVDKNGNFFKPHEISKTDLSSEYQIEKPEGQRLMQRLNLKAELQEKYLESIPEEKRETVRAVLDLVMSGKLSKKDLDQLIETDEDATSKDIEENLSEVIGTNDVDSWQPSVPPEEAEITSELFKPIIDENERNSVQTLTMQDGNSLSSEDSEKRVDETMKNRSNPDLNKEIGDWGEKCVYLYLKNQYKSSGKIVESKNGFLVFNEEEKAIIEARWLNINSQKGIGCDFVIKDEEKILKYIEVKSKTKEGAELIEITGAQWRLAEREQDRYWIYCVQGAVGKHPNIVRIQNPVKRWKDGAIDGRPIYLKFK